MLLFPKDYFEATCKHCSKVNEISNNIDVSKYKCLFCFQYMYQITPKEFNHKLQLAVQAKDAKEIKNLCRIAAQNFTSDELLNLTNGTI